MSTSKHIYYADSEYPKTVILNHGASETTVLYDSDEDHTTEEQKRLHYKRLALDYGTRRAREQIEKESQEKSWLPDALQRAKDAGDI